jgi:agmatine deiminase
MGTSHQSARNAGYRMPAEWEPHSHCWMAWPSNEALWGEILPKAQRGYAAVAQAIAGFEPVSMLTPPESAKSAKNLCGAEIEIVPWDLDDAWARDIGPNFLRNDGGELAASVFQFNAWGQKYEHFRKDAALGHRLCEALGIRSFSSPLFMEGGGINVDGEGTVLTTEQCILNTNRNPGISMDEAEEELCGALGAEKVIWLPGDPHDEDTDGHVDGLACFVRPGVVLAGFDPEPSSERHGILRKNIQVLQQSTDAKGRSLEIHFIEEAREIDAVSDIFCRSYINFYIANGGIVMPAYGIPSDQRSREVVAHCFPEREVVQVDVRAIAHGGGGIHCITQQQPA